MEKCLNIGKNVGKTDYQFSQPIFFSKERDTLVHKWPSLHLYAFPLGTLLPQFVRWIREDRCSALLVALLWQNQSWFPEMVQLLVAVPWPIPLRRNLLSQAKGTIWLHISGGGCQIVSVASRRESSSLPQRVVNTILEARMPSARRCLYTLRWPVFSDWCAVQKVDPFSCNIVSIWSFLQEWPEMTMILGQATARSSSGQCKVM